MTNLRVDMGLSWEGALQRLEDYRKQPWATKHPENGFWVGNNSNFNSSGRPIIILATEAKPPGKNHSGERTPSRKFLVRKPYDGAGTSDTVKLSDLETTHKKVSNEQARAIWCFWHAYLLDGCTHGRNCSARKAGRTCGYGSRIHWIRVLTGAVLCVWKALRYVTTHPSKFGIKSREKDRGRMRIVGALLDYGRRVVGLQASEEEIDALTDYLIEEAGGQDCNRQIQVCP